MTDEFLNFAYCSLTSGQKDIIDVKYHIANNMDMNIKQLTDSVNDLKLNHNICVSIESVRKIKKYTIPVIVDKINYESNIS